MTVDAGCPKVGFPRGMGAMLLARSGRAESCTTSCPKDAPASDFQRQMLRSGWSMSTRDLRESGTKSAILGYAGPILVRTSGPNSSKVLERRLPEKL